MQFFKYIMLVLFLSTLTSSFTFSQDRNIDKIEMLYDQGNYITVLKKTKKLQALAKYKSNAPLKLFEALAEYQLAKDKKKYSTENALSNFKAFVALDTLSEYDITYGVYIYDLQSGLVNAIRELEKEGSSKAAEEKYKEYSALFKHKATFKEITKTKPVIKEKAPLIIIPEDAPEEVKETSIKKQQKNILKEAKKHIGTKYKYGGITPKGFDCSGFTQYVMAKNNISLPRTSKAQALQFKEVKQKNAQVGDLVFFGRNKNKINHVGIISEVDKDLLYMIHASTSRGIMITEITTNIYWNDKLQFITRTLEK